MMISARMGDKLYRFWPLIDQPDRAPPARHKAWNSRRQFDALLLRARTKSESLTQRRQGAKAQRRRRDFPVLWCQVGLQSAGWLRIMEVYEVSVSGTTTKERGKMSRLLTLTEIVEELGVARHVIEHAILKHGIKPTRRAGIARLYDSAGLTAIKRALADTSPHSVSKA